MRLTSFSKYFYGDLSRTLELFTVRLREWCQLDGVAPDPMLIVFGLEMKVNNSVFVFGKGELLSRGACNFKNFGVFLRLRREDDHQVRAQLLLDEERSFDESLVGKVLEVHVEEFFVRAFNSGSATRLENGKKYGRKLLQNI